MTNAKSLHLVIFDCDGVLVDSERLTVEIENLLRRRRRDRPGAWARFAEGV